MNKKNSVNLYTIATLGLLIGIQVVLGRFFSIRTPIVTIGFGFIPIVIAAMMFGPVKAGIVGGLSDFIGAVLFPIGAYFPGFTLTAFITGMIYGSFLYKKQRTLLITVIGIFLVSLVDFGLNTYWLHLITGKAIFVLIPPRILQAVILFGVKLVTIRILDKQLVSRFLPRLSHS